MTTIQLIQGQFDTAEALDLVTQMVHVKIKFHENKIRQSLNEEDIKMREKKIIHLQKNLYEFRKQLSAEQGTVLLTSQIEVN